jgi:hypothetical protein
MPSFCFNSFPDMNQRRRWRRPSHSCKARELSRATNLLIPYVFFELVFCSLQTGQKNSILYKEDNYSLENSFLYSLYHAFYLYTSKPFLYTAYTSIIYLPSFHSLLLLVPYVALHISIYLLSLPSSLTSKILVFANFVCACIRYHLWYSNTIYYGI